MQTFTSFPLTALLRNAFGTLSPVVAEIVSVELFIVGAVFLRPAVHLFRYGSIEYGREFSIAGTFRRS